MNEKPLLERITPLPWTYHSGSIYQDGPDVFPKGQNKGIRIALMDREAPETWPPERDANAKFLTMAANNHASLIEACKLALSCLNACHTSTREGVHYDSTGERKALRMALNKVLTDSVA